MVLPTKQDATAVRESIPGGVAEGASGRTLSLLNLSGIKDRAAGFLLESMGARPSPKVQIGQGGPPPPGESLRFTTEDAGKDDLTTGILVRCPFLFLKELP